MYMYIYMYVYTIQSVYMCVHIHRKTLEGNNQNICGIMNDVCLILYMTFDLSRFL